MKRGKLDRRWGRIDKKLRRLKIMVDKGIMRYVKSIEVDKGIMVDKGTNLMIP
jgi:hypothetical protein